MKHVPPNLRRILSAESAANDGLAYPFLSISIYLTVESSRGVAIGKWFLIGWLCESRIALSPAKHLMFNRRSDNGHRAWRHSGYATIFTA